MNFRFTKGKTITAILVFSILELFIIFGFLASTISCLCAPDSNAFGGKDYYDSLPFPLTVCHCDSVPLSAVIGQYIALAFPLLIGAFVYVVWSFAQGKKDSRK